MQRHETEKLNPLPLLLLLIGLGLVFVPFVKHDVVPQCRVGIGFVDPFLQHAISVHEVAVEEGALSIAWKVSSVSNSCEIWRLEFLILVVALSKKTSSGTDPNCRLLK